jgi:hypothetical protein
MTHFGTANSSVQPRSFWRAPPSPRGRSGSHGPRASRRIFEDGTYAELSFSLVSIRRSAACSPSTVRRLATWRRASPRWAWPTSRTSRRGVGGADLRDGVRRGAVDYTNSDPTYPLITAPAAGRTRPVQCRAGGQRDHGHGALRFRQRLQHAWRPALRDHVRRDQFHDGRPDPDLCRQLGRGVPARVRLRDPRHRAARGRHLQFRNDP